MMVKVRLRANSSIASALMQFTDGAPAEAQRQAVDAQLLHYQVQPAGFLGGGVRLCRRVLTPGNEMAPDALSRNSTVLAPT